ncbi:ATP-binding protein [Streptomyces nigra]
MTDTAMHGGSRAGTADFLGRTGELAALRRCYEEAAQGRPRLVVIEGPAGIGKTALVRHFVDGTARGGVLTAAGEANEAALPYGVLDQLLELETARQVRPVGVAERALHQTGLSGARHLCENGRAVGEVAQGERHRVLPLPVVQCVAGLRLDHDLAVRLRVQRDVRDRALGLAAEHPDDLCVVRSHDYPLVRSGRLSAGRAER